MLKTDIEYQFKILVYPNITYYKDLNKDSYIIVIKNVIEALNQIRNDIHWTLILPYHCEYLEFDNVKQVLYDVPRYPPAMRNHFNVFQILDLLDWKNTDYDIVYSHLPEHTLQLKNIIYQKTNMQPRFIGYCHWFETEKNSGYKNTALFQNFLGVLEMEELGINSKWLKQFVLQQASSIFNEETLKRLDKIIQPHYLGVDSIDLTPSNKIHNSILFNHRDNKYTGFRAFIKDMDILWQERQDFKVFTTLASIQRPYLEKKEISNRQEYLAFLKQMYIGVGCFQDYSAWSIATTDGLSQGVPYLLPNGLCYPEMLGEDYPLLYDKNDFLPKLRQLLNHDKTRELVTAIEPIIESFLWSNRVSSWFNNWESLFDPKQYQAVQSGIAYSKIRELILEEGYVSKKEILDTLSWGVGIPFGIYRNRLRLDPDIALTENGYRKR